MWIPSGSSTVGWQMHRMAVSGFINMKLMKNNN
jgi:hypothetical protein